MRFIDKIKGTLISTFENTNQTNNNSNNNGLGSADNEGFQDYQLDIEDGITTPSELGGLNAEQVHPKVVKKTPKFPSRARHLAIRRKKTAPRPPRYKTEEKPVEEVPLDENGEVIELCCHRYNM
jgi:hypothetical protein